MVGMSEGCKVKKKNNKKQLSKIKCDKVLLLNGKMLQILQHHCCLLSFCWLLCNLPGLDSGISVIALLLKMCFVASSVSVGISFKFSTLFFSG